MLNLNEMVARMDSYLDGADLSTVKKAHAYAMKAHSGQKRKSGEPYVVHPIGVAGILTELRMDPPSVAAGLLHDSVEDTHTTAEELRILFGPEVAFLVEGVTKLKHLRYNTREAKQAENFRKMLLAMARDIRVMIIKLSDRLDNMRTLNAMKPDQQDRISRETLDIYAPIANRLGIHWMKAQLEDLSFQYLNPEAFTDMVAKVEKTAKPRRKFIEEVVRLLAKEMERADINCRVQGRPKHYFGIHQKIQKTGRELDQIHDIVAFRIVTENETQCYEALGRVHNLFVPIPGRFKDYIALPKPNGYRSLHTSVIWNQDGMARQLEVQIRDDEMHEDAEEGISAHWVYKEGKPLALKDEKRYQWLRQLMEAHFDISDPSEFIENVKIDLFDDEVYVFTPEGDVKALPKGATPVDFAFQIHSEVGNHCSGAKVNGIMVPLKYALHSGDTVEIITSPHQNPNKDWLKFVVTARARTKIRHFVRTAQREKGRSLGRDMLDRQLRKLKMSLPKLEKTKKLDEVCPAFRVANVDELLLQVGYGKISPSQVAEELTPPEDRQKAQQEEEKPGMVAQFLRKFRRPTTGVRVQGLDDVLVRMAKCCNPLPGDVVVGFVTRGRGVTVHVETCRKALDLDPDRRIEVTWDMKAKTMYPVSIRVITSNRPGLLANMSKCFSSHNVNINQANCRAVDNLKAINTFYFDVTNLDQLKTLVKNIQKIPGVFSVERVQNG